MASQTIGIQEFRDNLATLAEGGRTLQITQQGKTLGYFVPARKMDSHTALERIEETSRKVDALLASWGATEDELMAEIEEIRRHDKNQSLP